MAEPPVLVDRRDGYYVITLNRPARLNAFNVAMCVALAEAFCACETDPACRAVVLTGAGRGFCAGQDLTDGMMQSAGQQAVGEALDTRDLQREAAATADFAEGVRAFLEKRPAIFSRRGS